MDEHDHMTLPPLQLNEVWDLRTLKGDNDVVVERGHIGIHHR